MSANFRSNPIAEPSIFGGSYGLSTPVGTVRTQQPPPLPPRPYIQDVSNGGYGAIRGNGYGSYGGGLYGGGGYGGEYSGYGGFGGNLGGFGGSYGNYGGYGGYGGIGGYGGNYGYNRFGGGGDNPMDPEFRFIQMAEENSRPAFQSIESLVGTIGNIAMMLDSTFFALTSSFRAILGVAANFGRLRTVWTSLALFRGLTWLYRKILYYLKLSNLDPTGAELSEAFEAAQATHSMPGMMPDESRQPNRSAWPVLAFIGFIFTAPYLIMKLIGTATTSALSESKNPITWVNPIKSQALYTFQGSNAQELSILSGQPILVAPRDIQNTHKLLNTGWVLATVDGKHSGLIPVNYIRRSQPEQQFPANVNDVNVENQNGPNLNVTPDSSIKQSNDIPAMERIYNLPGVTKVTDGKLPSISEQVNEEPLMEMESNIIY